MKHLHQKHASRACEPSHLRLTRISAACALALGSTMLIASHADARITKVQITSRATAFGGYSFTGVGQYEKIVGMAFGELNPNDPRNSGIVDIQLAPKNANGKVEYSHTFYILKPLDLSKGNHKLMYDPPNRGGKRSESSIVVSRTTTIQVR